MARTTAVLVFVLLFAAALCFPGLCKVQEQQESERQGVVVDYSIQRQKSGEEKEEEKKSLLLAPGVLSFDGTLFHKVVPESVPSLFLNETEGSSEEGKGVRGDAERRNTNDDFYVSLCIFVAKEANGDHRGILFKGSRNEHRTPSIWLLPDSMQITYRVMVPPPPPPSASEAETTSESENEAPAVEPSTPNLPPQEVWATSRKELPLNSWTHLLLAVGKDLDDDGSIEEQQLKLRLYINGEVDSEIELPRAPLLNPGSLHLGKDISPKEGLTGFISQFEIGAVSAFQGQTREKVRAKFRSAMTKVSQITNQWTCDSSSEEERERSSKSRLTLLSRDSAAQKQNPIQQHPPKPHNSPSIKSHSKTRKLFHDNWSLLLDSIKDGVADEAKIHTLLELAWKNYLGSDNNPKSCDVGLFYMHRAAIIAYASYQIPGRQFIVENVELNERVGMERADHQSDNSDESHVLEMMAEQGNPQANLGLGNRFFYGIHGFEKNMSKALKYYKKAHDLDDPMGSIAYAKMQLRGDGVPLNGTKALEVYNSVINRPGLDKAILSEAENGVGYIYFYGHGVEKNQTTALTYFQRAADRGSSQGAFNAASLLDASANADDKSKAFHYFTVAAREGSALAHYKVAEYKTFGHWEIRRNCTEAFLGYWAMSQIGPWSTRLGDGLKLFLEGKHEESFESYLSAARMGYSYGLHNAIYLLQDRINRRNSFWQRLLGREAAKDSVLDDPTILPQLAEFLVESAAEGKLRAFGHNTLGNCHLQGQSHGCSAGSDPQKAAYHYQEALSDSVASYFNLGDVYFWGRGVIERNETKAFDLFKEGRAKAGRDLASILSVALYVFVDIIRKAWDSISSSSSSSSSS